MYSGHNIISLAIMTIARVITSPHIFLSWQLMISCAMSTNIKHEKQLE